MNKKLLLIASMTVVFAFTACNKNLDSKPADEVIKVDCLDMAGTAHS